VSYDHFAEDFSFIAALGWAASVIQAVLTGIDREG
jgi:hypothetical protein